MTITITVKTITTTMIKTITISLEDLQSSSVPKAQGQKIMFKYE